MRGLAGLWLGGGLEKERGKQHKGTGLDQPQLTGKGAETGGELGKRPEGGRGSGGRALEVKCGVLFS